jgi:hypothetical protein
VIAAVLRLIFVFIGGRFYYGRPDYFIQGDTSAWFQAFFNLLDFGTFTVNPNVEASKFFRPPGYSFLFGIFYLITFKNYVLAWKLLVAMQVIMDIVSVFLIARITGAVMKNSSAEKRIFLSNFSALLYAIYPTAIVFMPLLQAETPSILFLLLGIWFAFRPRNIRNAFLSGAFAGIATLFRLQCAFSIPFILLAFLSRDAEGNLKKMKHALLFCFAVALTYGLWPARNYLLHDRIVFSQDIHVGGHWSDDFIAFLDFTHSVSTDHTPYYWSILKDEKVNWPAEAYLDPGDSALLDSAVMLSRTCSNSFALWKSGEHLTKEVKQHDHPCDSAITTIYNSLTAKQKSRNAFHYWITIPLQNLEKCFFKFTLYGNKPWIVKISGRILFIIRSLLVLCGLIGIFLAYRKNLMNRKFLLLVFGYMMTWYLFISVVHRNIEMRYLLHTDVLLLIPAAFALMVLFFNKYLKAYG